MHDGRVSTFPFKKNYNKHIALGSRFFSKRIFEATDSSGNEMRVKEILKILDTFMY